jgi:serine protease Do
MGDPTLALRRRVEEGARRLEAVDKRRTYLMSRAFSPLVRGHALSFAVVAALFITSSCALWDRTGIGSDLKLAPKIREAMETAISAVKPALVRIHVVQVQYYGGRAVKYEASGSGVIISEDGYVITNHHVAGKAKEIVCTLSNKEEVEAERVGTDPLTDITVLKLPSGGDKQYPFARFGDSSKLNVGDRVLAMGSPLDLSQSVTLGIASNTELVMLDSSYRSQLTVEGERVGSIVLWIGHDAEIYPGNSGGPLVNLAGEIIGINEIRMGLGGAIPSNIARDVSGELIENGKVTRSWTGLEIQPTLKSSEDKKGALVAGTIEDSPADKAGFESGDILLSFAGQEIDVRYPEQLPRFIQLTSAIPVGREVEAIVRRDGEEKRLMLVTEERQRAQEDTHELKRWGITARDISLIDSKELQRENRNGVIVYNTRPGGPCDEAKPAIRGDDVITAVNGEPVTNVADLLKITDEINEGQDEPVPVNVSFERKTEEYLTVVKVGIKELQQSALEVRKAWLPVATQVLTRDMAEALGIQDRTGVRVTQVYPGTEAEEIGLQVGDLIVELDGEPIRTSYQEDYEVFPTMVRQYKIGSEVELTVLRGDDERKIKVKLPVSQRLEREMKKYRDDRFEFTVRNVAFLDKVRAKWEPDVQGVLVHEVVKGGWAALGNLAVDDLIKEVDGQPVTDVDSMKEIMEKIAEREPEHVLFHVLRGIHNMFIELEPDWESEVRNGS